MKHLMIAALALALAGPVAAQQTHNMHVAVTEPGQSAFAAIAEIVAVLRSDPKTDWSSVDIDALREHLVDMEQVTTQATATTTVSGQQVSFVVSGDGQVETAIRRMATAHAPMLATETGWKVSVVDRPGGVEMSIISDEPAKVSALGFFGVMTIGAHHQAHHLQIATGNNPHHH